MKSRKRTQLYAPSAEQLGLFPAISGNAVNGVGERGKRPPTKIFWGRPEELIHSELQAYIGRKFYSHPLLGATIRGEGEWGRGPEALNPVAAEKTQAPPQKTAAALKAFALAHEADLVGIVRYDPLWTFEGSDPILEEWIVVLGVAMDYDALSEAPAEPAAHEVLIQYNRGARAAKALSNWIHARGYPSTPHKGPQAGRVLLIPAALACGFGELGKHGSIINRQFGSSLRLAAVTIELPLVADEPDHFGADDFCTRCRVCVDACPPDAISEVKDWVRGEKKWFVDFDKCIPYFNETYGCAICIAACPWSVSGRAPRLAEKWGRRSTRPSAD